MDVREPKAWAQEIADAADRWIPGTAVTASPDVDSLARLLVLVRVSLWKLKNAEQFVEDELVNAMSTHEWDVPGLGRITLRSGAKRTKWDHPAAVDACVHAIGADIADLVDPESGEVWTGTQIVRTVIERYLEAATPSWKVTGLRALHIDPGDYCTTEWGRKTIQTPPIEDALTTTEGTNHDRGSVTS